MKAATNFVCLAYHRITDNPAAQQDPLTITPATFRAHMEWLAHHQYQAISLGAAQTVRPRQRHIALTFDDGTDDFVTTAWPILLQYGFNATLFIVTGCVGKTANWRGGQNAPLLTWSALCALAAQGLEIGLHGHYHHPFDSLETAVLASELTVSQQIAADQLGYLPTGLAYPYGTYSSAVINTMQAAGFAWAASTRGGKNKQDTNPFALRRTLIMGSDNNVWLFGKKVLTGYAKLVEWRMDMKRVK